MNPLSKLALTVVSKASDPKFLQLLQSRTDTLKRLDLAKIAGRSQSVIKNLDKSYMNIIRQMIKK